MKLIVKKFVHACLCVVALFVFAGSALAGADTAAIRTVIERLGSELAADPAIPGVSIAVLRQGEDEPVCAAFGKASLENDVPMNTSSKFRIGSVTKVFTATLIHRLIEQGKLSYDTTVERFFPQLPYGKLTTIRQLLNHTSGIPDMFLLTPVYSNMAQYRSPEEIISLTAQKPLIFQPGTEQQYINTAFIMLAEIAEQVGGKPYNEQIHELFVKKLGMKSLDIGDDTTIVHHLVRGYSFSKENKLILPIKASLAMAKGTGFLEATPGDVVRLVNLNQVLENNLFDTLALEPLILANGQSTLTLVPDMELECRQSFLDGCTLFMFKNPDLRVLGKLGSFPGFGTAFVYDQQTRIGVVISLNTEKRLLRTLAFGARILHDLR